MKKIIISLLVITGIILIGLLLKDVTIQDNYARDERFIKIYEHDYFYIVYDIKSKVEYVVSDGAYNRGTFTLLIDRDGKPLLYEEE